jgi:hypothetical protein
VALVGQPITTRRKGFGVQGSGFSIIKRKLNPEPRTLFNADSPNAVAASVGHPPRSLPHGDPAVNDDINVLALIKGKERYIFLYDDSQRAEALRMLGRHASNPELSFSWYDAAVLSQKIRQEERQQRSRLRLPQVTDSEELF